ncbi:MAG: Ribonuclease R [Holosporales bacterium]
MYATLKGIYLCGCCLMKKNEKPVKSKRFMKKIPQGLIFGCARKIDERQFQVTAIHRKDAFPGIILDGVHAKSIKDGDVFSYTLSLKNFQFVEHIGNISDPNIYALMALKRHHLPCEFSQNAIKEAQAGKVPALDKYRKDLRDIPFVTIDGDDAKDFDDAVYAEPLNQDEFRIMVAIADVSYYVLPGSALDDEAKERGNSVYTPGFVVPMLPEALSNDLCSLKPNEDRAALCADMVINAKGEIVSSKFVRCLIQSKARLTYTQVQNAIDGKWSKVTEPLKNELLNLFTAYKILKTASTKRGTINLSFPEYKIVFDEAKNPLSVTIEKEMVSNQLIEEMMILANVCAAKTLTVKKCPTLFRVHEKPEEKGYNKLRNLLQSFGFTAPKAHDLTPHVFNHILNKISESENAPLFQELVLRAQAQAKYSPQNVGHFGLSLSHYAHFTSPIRRYADLVVHRCLVTALGLDQPIALEPLDALDGIAEHISKTERLAAVVERETFERYVYQLLKSRQIFEGRIAGLVEAGIFIKLEKMGAEGFIPVRQLDDDYYVFEERNHRFVGRKKRTVYQLGQSLTVKVVKADPLTCNLDLVPVMRYKPIVDKNPPKEEGHKKKDKKRNA